MEKKQNDTDIIQEKESDLSAPDLAVKRGKTTFQIGLHFSTRTKESLEEKLKRLLEKEVSNMKIA